MIWAILALIGVPLWLCAIAILSLVVRNRGLRKRRGNVSVRLRKAPGKRWIRGHGIWVHDVFAFRSSPAGWSEALVWVSSAATREPTPDDGHKLRHLDRPVVAAFAVEGGATIELASGGVDQAALLGPFAVDLNGRRARASS